MNNETEVWKAIELDLFQEYEVSNLGNIRKLNKQSNNYEYANASISSNGDKIVILTNGTNRLNTSLSRLVCYAFKKPSETDLLLFSKIKSNFKLVPYKIKYLDGNKLNCCIDNLEWDIKDFTYNIGSDTEEWKEILIDNIKNYFISNWGNVKYKEDSEEYIVKQHQYSNGYKYVSIYKQEGLTKNYSVHRLVGLAFIEPPTFGSIVGDTKVKHDNVPFHINHKDGNKQNNCVDNLEWVNMSENSNHALTAGLNKSSCHVEVNDIKTGTLRTYKSMSELSKDLNIANPSLVINNYTTCPYQGRYLFKVISVDIRSERAEEEQSPDKAVYALDYVTRNITIYKSARHAEKATGIVENSIKQRAKIPLDKRPNKTLGGYDFYMLKNINIHNPPLFKNISIKQAKADRNYMREMIGQGLASYMKVSEVLDLKTGDVRSFNSLKKAAIDTGVSYTLLKQRVRLGRDNKLATVVGNYSFRYKDSNQEWPCV